MNLKNNLLGSLFTRVRNKEQHYYYKRFITDVFLKRGCRNPLLPSRHRMIARLRRLQRRHVFATEVAA